MDTSFKAGEIKSADGFVIKDTGNREVFSTGAQRDSGGGIKGWFHCLPFVALKRWAQHLQAGGMKYQKLNMRKGLPLSSFLDSADRHLHALMDHQTDEDHAAAVLWNIGEFMWTLEAIQKGVLPRELYDLDFPHENGAAVLLGEKIPDGRNT